MKSSHAFFSIVPAAAVLLAGMAMSAGAAPLRAPKTGVPYSKVQALLNSECVSCHGAKSHAGKVDLHSYAAVMASSVVVKGKAAKSRLVLFVNGAKQPQMPMGKKALSTAQVNLLKTWINQGAKSN